MTFRRALIRALDRPGGRTILGAAVTCMARRYAAGVRAGFYRGMWVHWEGGVVFVDAPTLAYRRGAFVGWANELERSLTDAADHWMYVRKPRRGDVILEIGAGKGEDTIAFSRMVGPEGRVVAVEAHPVTYRALLCFCQWNHLDNVTALNLAITDRPGTVSISGGDDWWANSIGADGLEGAIQVPGRTCDEVVRHCDLSRIDLLKMNIEGAEARALAGMEQTLGITRALCISCHDFRANRGHGEFFRTKAFVADAVERAGFRIVSRAEDPRPYVSDQVNGLNESTATSHDVVLA